MVDIFWSKKWCKDAVGFTLINGNTHNFFQKRKFNLFTYLSSFII